MNWKRKLSAALTGVEVFSHEKHDALVEKGPAATGDRRADLIAWSKFRDERRLVDRCIDPSSYLVGLALGQHFEHALRRTDKMAWTTTVVFSGGIYELNDWKRSSWEMYGPRTEQVMVLIRKISAAATILGGAFHEENKRRIAEGDFALSHQSLRLLLYYLIQREEAERLVTLKPGNEELVKVGERVTEGGSKIERFRNVSMNKYLSDWRRADAAAVAAVILFFGLLEIIFDAFFVFGDRRGLTYQQFRGLDWRERFKFVVDVTKSPAKEAYEEMVRVQRRHRHVVSHGAPLFVVQHRGLGFIPADPLDATSPQTNPLYAFDADEVAATFATFDRTLAVFETHPTLWFAYKYVQTPLLLYLDDKSVQEIVGHSGSAEEFDAEIDRRLEILDRIINMEY
jgi:hypothetical protein